MKTITELLYYLDTTARVSCPEITCERAAELAEVMRGMLRSLECEVCEDQSNTIEALKQARIAEIDCGQEGICARPPSCQKHWAFRASELARERDEARRHAYKMGRALKEAGAPAVAPRPIRGEPSMFQAWLTSTQAAIDLIEREQLERTVGGTA